MDIQKLSKTYTVRKIEDSDIPALFELCRNNPKFYRHCPPFVTKDNLKADLRALPPGKSYEDKFYVGFWDGSILVAVMDLIVKYPDPETAFIGFFMVESSLHSKGLGSRLVGEIFSYLAGDYNYVRLGYVKGNKQSEHFWLKNGFIPTGVMSHTELYDIIILQKELSQYTNCM